MRSLLERVRHLRRGDPSRADAALLATLPHAGPDERDALISDLLDWLSTPALRPRLTLELASRWPLLSPSARAALRNAAGQELTAGAQCLAARESPTDRAAAAQIALDAALSAPHDAAPLLVLVERLSRDPLPSVCEPASEAAALLIESGRDAGRADHLLSAALDTFAQHRSARIMTLVARRACHAAGPLRAWLDDPRRAGHLELRSAARRLPEDEAHSLAVRWLGVRALVPVAVERLRHPRHTEDQQRLLAQAHLLLCPARRHTLNRLDRSDRFLPGPAAVAGMPPTMQRGMVHWLARLPMRPEARAARLGALLALPDACARLLAARALAAADACAHADAALLEFSLDADPRIAVAACHGLASARPTRRVESTAPALRLLRRSPHPRVRALAAQSLPLGDALACDGPLRAPVAAARRARIEPESHAIALRAALEAAQGARAVALIDLVHRTGALSAIEPQLARALAGSDPHAASKAAKVLGMLEGDGALALLRDCLGHSDPRVCANAIEGLERRALRAPDAERRDIAALVRAQAAEGRPARVRATAVRALMRGLAEPHEAHRALLAMLRDERPAHRGAALWAAHARGAADALSAIEELAHHDLDDAVRAQAARCAAHLRLRLRDRWAAPAGARTSPAKAVGALRGMVNKEPASCAR